MATVDDYLADLDEPLRLTLGRVLSTIRFSVDTPLPDDVVREIVRLRAGEIDG